MSYIKLSCHAITSTSVGVYVPYGCLTWPVMKPDAGNTTEQLVV